MEIAALLVMQLAVTALAFGALWRRLDHISADLARVKRMLETLEMVRVSGAAPKRAQPARAEAAMAPGPSAPATARDPIDDPFDAAWVRHGARAPRGDRREPAPPPRTSRARAFVANESADENARERRRLSPQAMRLISSAAMALAPLLTLAAGAPERIWLAAGLSIGAILMLVSLRPLWRASAWVGALAAGGWALAGFVAGAVQAAPALFSTFATLAGAAGLAHARQRALRPGALMALLMGAAMLGLSSVAGLIGPAGAAFGALVAIAALLGASSERIEALHLAAFTAAMGGLYVLTGQSAAAIWFTPIAAWVGALFFAIAFVRVPALGARGAVLAATGVAAPILAAGMLSLSQHGLADRFAAAGVFAALAALFGVLLAIAARRTLNGVESLQLSAWVLMSGALVSFASAAVLAVPAPFSVTVLAAAAFGLVVFDARLPHVLWRVSALGLVFIAAIMAWGVTAAGWPSLLTIATGLAAPALFAGAAAALAQRKSPGIAAIFEAGAIVGAVAGSVALFRLALSGGAPNTMPVGFFEVGVQISALGALSLGLAARAHRGAGFVRRAAASLLGFAALGLSVVAGLLWLTPFWAGRLASGVDWAPFQHAPLGFAPLAVAAWAHWLFWRTRPAYMCTRVALAIAALLSAAFISLEVLTARGPPAPGQTDWIAILALVLSFGLAIGINFAPGIRPARGAALGFQENFERNRRRQQRR